MTDTETIAMLRTALAAIWVNLEKEWPWVAEAQGIADEALKFSRAHAPEGKDLTGDDCGWERFKTRHSL